VIEVGMTRKTGMELQRALSPHFSLGTYDLVFKNCNSFTDASLAYLLSRRLPAEYTFSDQLGKDMPKMLSMLTDGRYAPNPEAEQFNLESVILRVDPNAWMGTAKQLNAFNDAPVTPKAKARGF